MAIHPENVRCIGNQLLRTDAKKVEVEVGWADTGDICIMSELLEKNTDKKYGN